MNAKEEKICDLQKVRTEMADQQKSARSEQRVHMSTVLQKIYGTIAAAGILMLLGGAGGFETGTTDLRTSMVYSVSGLVLSIWAAWKGGVIGK